MAIEKAGIGFTSPVPSGGTAHVLDTDEEYLAGILFQIRNAGTGKVSVDHAGRVTLEAIRAVLYDHGGAYFHVQHPAFGETAAGAEDGGANPDGLTGNYDVFNRANSAAEAWQLGYTGTYVIEQDITIDAGLFSTGAVFQPANGVKITTTGPIQSEGQIFDLSAGGTVSITPGSVDKIPVHWFGIVADGVTDQNNTLENVVNNCANGIPLRFRYSDLSYYCNGALTLTNTKGVVFLGDPGVVIKTDHGSNGFDIKSADEDIGPVSSATSDTVTVTGAGWTVDEHADKWVEVGTTTVQRRRVVSNTSDTITVSEVWDVTPSGTETLTANEKIDRVVMHNIHFQGDSGSTAGACVIWYAKHLELRNFKSTQRAGNGLSIYGADHGRIYDFESDDTQLGLFVYLSQDVIAYGATPKNTTGGSGWGVEFKDCEDSHIIDPYPFNCPIGASIKASGLNPARNCSIRGGSARECGVGYKEYALANEGTTFPAENFSIVNPSTIDCNTDVQTQAGTGAAMHGVSVLGGSLKGSKVLGISLLAPGTKVSGISVIDGLGRAMDIAADDCSVRGSEFRNNNRDGTDAELRIDGAQRVVVEHNDFVHDDAASLSNRAITELAGDADNNRFGPNRILEAVEGYGQDYAITGASTVARYYPGDYHGTLTANATAI